MIKEDWGGPFGIAVFYEARIEFGIDLELL